MDGLPVGEVARLAGVTVRTLHHYDEIGLLRPGGRTTAGYRRYDERDLLRLQRVLAYRELGLGLDEIGRLLDAPRDEPDDELVLLRRQHEEITRRIERLRQVLAAVQTTMEARTMGIDLTPQEILEVFGDDDPTRYADEAQERWGGTDAWEQSQRRTRAYTAADWRRMREEQDAVNARLAAAMSAGLPADGVEAMDAAQAHRELITAWFYDCDPQRHRALADLYVSDPRFTATYERVAAGLAQYVHDAVHANADRSGS